MASDTPSIPTPQKAPDLMPRRGLSVMQRVLIAVAGLVVVAIIGGGIWYFMLMTKKIVPVASPVTPQMRENALKALIPNPSTTDITTQQKMNILNSLGK